MNYLIILGFPNIYKIFTGILGRIIEIIAPIFVWLNYRQKGME